MAHTPDFADLEILIRRQEAQGYPVKLVLDAVRILGDGLLDPACLPQDFLLDAQATGEQLFDCLLAGASLRDAWYTARGGHPQRRIRLHIDAGAPELHALPWELLRDPGDDKSTAQNLAAAADTPLSALPGAVRPRAGPAGAAPPVHRRRRGRARRPGKKSASPHRPGPGAGAAARRAGPVPRRGAGGDAPALHAGRHRADAARLPRAALRRPRPFHRGTTARPYSTWPTSTTRCGSPTSRSWPR
ncbi:MAG: hypothetical protein V9H69_24385 [Anaerolineae bacterium]